MPPPPKPATPPAPGTPADEADRLGREHSNKREMKMRQERVRALADEAPASRRGGSGLPAGAPVVQPRPPSGASRIPDVEGPPPQRTPAAPRPAERDRQDRAERADKPDRAEKNVVERPISSRAVVEKPIEAPHEAPPSVIDDVGVEAEEFLRETAALWARFAVADKISFISALGVFVGTLLPWLWRKNEEVTLGIGCGGVVHAFIAVLAIWLLFDRERDNDRGMRPGQQKKKARRTALWMLLLALMSTLTGIWFFFVYGAIRRFEVPTVEVSLGLYVTLAAGLGLSYSGFAYFWRGGRE